MSDEITNLKKCPLCGNLLSEQKPAEGRPYRACLACKEKIEGRQWARRMKRRNEAYELERDGRESEFAAARKPHDPRW